MHYVRLRYGNSKSIISSNGVAVRKNGNHITVRMKAKNIDSVRAGLNFSAIYMQFSDKSFDTKPSDETDVDLDSFLEDFYSKKYRTLRVVQLGCRRIKDANYNFEVDFQVMEKMK